MDAPPLTKPELKETHLGPLSAFSRSPSTSTITGDKEKEGKTSIEATTPTHESAIGRNIFRLFVFYANLLILQLPRKP